MSVEARTGRGKKAKESYLFLLNHTTLKPALLLLDTILVLWVRIKFSMPLKYFYTCPLVF